MISIENANTAGLEIADEIAKLFEQASEKRVVVKLDSIAEAEKLRFKLHHVRKQMRRHTHPLLEKAERVNFRVKDNVLTAQPSNDAKFKSAISAALNPDDGKEKESARKRR